MRRLGNCLEFKLTVFCFTTFICFGFALHDSVHAITESHGRPYYGRLANGIPFPTQFRGYQLREQDRTYTTPELAGAVLDAIESVRALQPGTCDLYLGDFSRAGGGPFTCHRSHQNGRDVDLGMYAKGNRTLTSLVPMNEENLDTAKTWCLIEGLLRSQRVQYIFLDRRIQKLLYDYAAGQGVDIGYLDRLFGSDRGAVIRHVPNHVDHIHARFFTPWSTLAAHVNESEEQKRMVIEMAQQAYLPKKVQYYAKGSERGIDALAKSFGVTSRDLCRWNNLRGGEALVPGSCLVFYKRGFELEPVHLAQSLQPNTLPASPVKLASLRPAQETISDAPPAPPQVETAKEKRVSPETSGFYTVRRGDTVQKIARSHGIDAATLREWNGMGKGSSRLRPGQKVIVTSAHAMTAPPQQKTAADLPKVNQEKPAPPIVDSKKAKTPVTPTPVVAAPITHTISKGDSLPKIAKKYGLTVDELCRLNNMKKTATIKPSQKLIVAMVTPPSKHPDGGPKSAHPGQAAHPETGKTTTALMATASPSLSKSASTTKGLSSEKHGAASNSAPSSKSSGTAKSTPSGKQASTKSSAKATQPPAKAQAQSKPPAGKAASTSKRQAAPAASHSSGAKNASKSTKNDPPAKNDKSNGSGKLVKQARR